MKKWIPLFFGTKIKERERVWKWKGCSRLSIFTFLTGWIMRLFCTPTFLSLALLLLSLQVYHSSGSCHLYSPFQFKQEGTYTFRFSLPWLAFDWDPLTKSLVSLSIRFGYVVFMRIWCFFDVDLFVCFFSIIQMGLFSPFYVQQEGAETFTFSPPCLACEGSSFRPTLQISCKSLHSIYMWTCCFCHFVCFLFVFDA